MADESAEEDHVCLSRHVQGLHEDSNTSQASAEVFVISDDDDDDEIKIVELKPENNGLVADEKPTKYAEVATEDEKESPRDQTCSVCLGEFDNKAFLDQCFHAFCFYCILQWSEVVHTCPLCKSSFSSIIHTVKSMEDFQQHFLPGPAVAAAATGEEGRRFRYRTTLAGDQEQRRRQRQNAWELRAQRRQAYQTAQRNREAVTREKRRMVYTNCLWVQGVSQQGKPKYRDVSPGFFRANPACTHRLVPWLKRELGVLLNDSESHVHFIQQLVMTLINKVEIGSDEFSRQLRPFLMERTGHFSHEFYSFARSPFDMTAYDERAQYSWPESIDEGRPGTETPTVFHGFLTGWETPASPEGPTHSRWDRDSPPQQQIDSLWSPDSSRETASAASSGYTTEITGHRGNKILQNVRLSVNIDTAEIASDRHRGNEPMHGSVDEERSGTKTLSLGRSQREVESSRTRSRSRTRSQSRARSRSRSRRSSLSKSLSKPRHKDKHKLQHNHKRIHKHRHGHRKKDEPHRDKVKCEDNTVEELDPSKPGPSYGRHHATAGEYHGGTANVIVVSSDGTTSPDQARVQQAAPRTHESSSTGSSRSRTSRRKKSRSRSRSNSRNVSRSPLFSRSRKSRQVKSPTGSRSNYRTESRSSPQCHKSSDSKSGKRSRHGKSRTRSRSNSRTESRSPQRYHKLSYSGKSEKRSRHGKSRGTLLRSNFRTASACPRASSESEGVSSSCTVPTGLSSLQESQSSPARPQSPSVEEMEREIQELEVRMAEDKKRLLQLLLKQEERKMRASNDSPGPS